MFGVGGSDVIGQDEDARVRRYAAETLGRLGSATAEVLSYVLQLSETTGLDFLCLARQTQVGSPNTFCEQDLKRYTGIHDIVSQVML